MIVKKYLILIWTVVGFVAIIFVFVFVSLLTILASIK